MNQLFADVVDPLIADEIDPGTISDKPIIETGDDSTIAIIVLAAIATIVVITVAIVIAKKLSKKNGK